MINYMIAIDLHGTLLGMRWDISPQLTQELCDILDYFGAIAEIYVCTGNDSSFVQKHLPRDIHSRITGLILESGCILERSGRVEYLTTAQSVQHIKSIETFLKSRQYPFAKYFATRESTISIFTTDENGGEFPEQFADIVASDLKSHEYGDEFYLTWSNVAIDIIPAGVSKWSALQSVADGKTLVSFMDSYNDKEIALYSDFTFLPQNTAPALISHLRANNTLVFPLSRFYFLKGSSFLCQKSYTEAVIEGLHYLKKYI